MSIWENQSKQFQESVTDAIFRWSKKERSEKRKNKIKRLYDKSER